MKKLTTEQAQLFLTDFFKQNGYNTNAEDWVSKKKYKNFNGSLCRDFYNEKIKKSAILMENLETGAKTVLEDKNFQYFVDVFKKTPIFYFTPAISNDGLVFVFEFANLEIEVEQEDELLNNCLKKLFPTSIISVFRDGDILLGSITNFDMGEIVAVMENNQLKFNQFLQEKIETLNAKYIGITPDDALVYYKSRR